MLFGEIFVLDAFFSGELITVKMKHFWNDFDVFREFFFLDINHLGIIYYMVIALFIIPNPFPSS